MRLSLILNLVPSHPMSTTQSVLRAFPAPLAGAVQALWVEFSTLAHALVNPGQIIAEVEEMRALRAQADLIEATDPTGADALRRRAARVGLLD